MLLIPPPTTSWCDTNYLLADWTVVVNNERTFQVNSAALATNSRYFNQAFAGNRARSESKSTTISRITKVKYPDLETVKDMLDFIAKISSRNEQLSDDDLLDLLSTDRLKSRLRAARDFAVPRLIDAIVSSALRNLTHSNCWDVLAIAADADCACDMLELVAKEYILCHFCQVAEESQFVNSVSFVILCDLLRSDSLNVTNEAKLFDVICRWVNADQQTRLCYFPRLLLHVRLGRVKSAQMNEILVHELVSKTSIECNRVYKLTSKSFVPSYQMQQDESLLRSLLHQPRLPHQAIFMCGGWESHLSETAHRMSSSVQIFDPNANTWMRHDTYLPAMDTGLVEFACVELDNVVYIIGGIISAASGLPPSDLQRPTARLMAYSLRWNVWRIRASMYAARHCACACVCNRRLYVMGGFERSVAVSTAESYEPEQNRWTSLALMQVPRARASAASVNGLVYVCGGCGRGDHYRRSMEQYSSADNQWTIVAFLQIGRSGLQMCPFGNVLYVMGGYNGTQVSDIVLRFNPVSNSWSQSEPMVFPRKNFGACILNGHLHVFGGSIPGVDRSDQCAIERCSLDGSWKLVGSLPLPADSFGCCTIFGCDFIEPLLSRK